MFSEKADKEKMQAGKSARKNRAAEIANTFESLITAFILALIVIEFVMQAFRIPTGSMADTLMGAHFRLRCYQCGYQYNYGFNNQDYGSHEGSVPRGPITSPASHCPSCGYDQRVSGATLVSNGDRILVLKCIYQFFKPKQWDVVVFKNPLEPTINYIKRLIGRPGETVEIIDGDVYIDGQISRKPPKVQNELWMPIYDNDYQPARPLEGSFNGHNRWHQPFNTANSKWTTREDSPTMFYLDSPADEINTLFYDTTKGNDFRASYSYNDVRRYDYMPYCSDLMVRFYAKRLEPDGQIGIELRKYQTNYKGRVDSTGKMVITKIFDKEEIQLAEKQIQPIVTGKSTFVKFANVDHQLILEFGGEKLTFDLGRDPNSAGPRAIEIIPQAKILGSGKLVISHIGVFRDIYYTTASGVNRACEGNPFKLEEDQFFVLGDNSPNSADGRWWNKEGIGNNGKSYRKGIVPQDYLVGKAMFVYWPSGFKPFARFPFSIVPNVGRMRFIYGGSGKGK